MFSWRLQQSTNNLTLCSLYLLVPVKLLVKYTQEIIGILRQHRNEIHAKYMLFFIWIPNIINSIWLPLTSAPWSHLIIFICEILKWNKVFVQYIIDIYCFLNSQSQLFLIFNLFKESIQTKRHKANTDDEQCTEAQTNNQMYTGLVTGCEMRLSKVSFLFYYNFHRVYWWH